MRTKYFPMFAMFAFAGFFCTACDNEDSDVGSEYRAGLYDPKFIDKTFSYVLDDTDLLKLRVYPSLYDGGNNRNDNLNSTLRHEPLSYRNMRILISLHPASRTYDPDINPNLGAEDKALGQVYKYVETALKKISLTESQAEAFNEQWIQRPIEEAYLPQIPFFITAYHSGEMKIVADKLLFGKDAGTDLSEHFMAEGAAACLPHGTLKDFDFLFWYDQAPCRLKARDFFAKDTWLQMTYVLWLCDIPEEQYDEVTFTLELPVACQCVYQYFYEGLEEIPMEEKVLRYRNTVHFGALSDFDEKYNEYRAENDHLRWW